MTRDMTAREHPKLVELAEWEGDPTPMFQPVRHVCRGLRLITHFDVPEDKDYDAEKRPTEAWRSGVYDGCRSWLTPPAAYFQDDNTRWSIITCRST